MTWRNASLSVDISSCRLFQVAWVDGNGRIISFSPVESGNRVNKYFNSNTLEVLYKLFPMAYEEMFILESGNLWQSDSTGLNWTNIVPPEESYFYLSLTDTPVKLGDTYIVSDYYGDISTTTDFITFEYKISSYYDSVKLIKLSETEVVAIDYGFHEYHYSIDSGQTWGTVQYGYYFYNPRFFANNGKLASITDFYVDGYGGGKLYEEKASISGANWDISYTSSTPYHWINDITVIGDKIAFACTRDGGHTEFIAVLNQAPSGNSWTHDSIIFTSPTRVNNSSWMRENILLINENLDYTFHFNPPGTNYSSATPPVSGDNVLFKNKKNNKYYIKSSTNILESNTPEGPWTEKTINVPLNIAWYF